MEEVACQLLKRVRYKMRWRNTAVATPQCCASRVMIRASSAAEKAEKAERYASRRGVEARRRRCVFSTVVTKMVEREDGAACPSPSGCRGVQKSGASVPVVGVAEAVSSMTAIFRARRVAAAHGECKQRQPYATVMLRVFVRKEMSYLAYRPPTATERHLEAVGRQRAIKLKRVRMYSGVGVF